MAQPQSLTHCAWHTAGVCAAALSTSAIAALRDADVGAALHGLLPQHQQVNEWRLVRRLDTFWTRLFGADCIDKRP